MRRSFDICNLESVRQGFFSCLAILFLETISVNLASGSCKHINKKQFRRENPGTFVSF